MIVKGAVDHIGLYGGKKEREEGKTRDTKRGNGYVEAKVLCKYVQIRERVNAVKQKKLEV